MNAAVIGTLSGEVSARRALRSARCALPSARSGAGRLGDREGLAFATMALRPVRVPALASPAAAKRRQFDKINQRLKLDKLAFSTIAAPAATDRRLVRTSR